MCQDTVYSSGIEILKIHISKLVGKINTKRTSSRPSRLIDRPRTSKLKSHHLLKMLPLYENAAPRTVAFIGIGNMGWGMAMNVASNLPSSSKLIVYDVDTRRLSEFLNIVRNAERVTSPKEAAEKCVSFCLY